MVVMLLIFHIAKLDSVLTQTKAIKLNVKPPEKHGKETGKLMESVFTGKPEKG
jgi:hypothetical protein